MRKQNLEVQNKKYQSFPAPGIVCSLPQSRNQVSCSRRSAQQSRMWTQLPNSRRNQARRSCISLPDTHGLLCNFNWFSQLDVSHRC